METNLPTNRNFGIVFFIVFLIVSVYPLFFEESIRIWSLVLSMIFLILGIINSKLLTPLNKIWIKFGILLGRIVAPIVMFIIFFLIVTPTAYLLRIFGKDVLNIKKKDVQSYWIKKGNNQSTMKDQF